MTRDMQSIHDDLAFLKAIAADDPSRTLRPAGAALLAAGLLYGLQCLANWLALALPLELPGAAWLALGFGPTALFLLALAWILTRDRAPAPRGGTSRGVTAAFQAVGLANLVLIAMFAPAALRAQDWSIWFFYPAVLMAQWGAAWLIVCLLRRRAWPGAVAAGSFASAIAMAQLTDSPQLYLLIIGGALIAFMAIPGAVMMRQPRAADATSGASA